MSGKGKNTPKLAKNLSLKYLCLTKLSRNWKHRTYIHGNKSFNWSWLNLNSRGGDLDHTPVKNLIGFWQTSDRLESDFENDISACVLNHSIANFPILFVLLLLNDQNNVAILRLASSHIGFLDFLFYSLSQISTQLHGFKSDERTYFNYVKHLFCGGWYFPYTIK